MTALLLALALVPAAHVDAATAAAREYHIEPALLLAIAKHETSGTFNASAINVTDGRMSCGAMQVRVRFADVFHCWQLLDVRTGYLEGAAVLPRWLAVAHGDLRVALNAYGCGTWGLTHACRDFAPYVIGLSARYRREARS